MITSTSCNSYAAGNQRLKTNVSTLPVRRQLTAFLVNVTRAFVGGRVEKMLNIRTATVMATGAPVRSLVVKRSRVCTHIIS